jgi:DNA-binding LacI/PurR family transcriptional regulator
MGNNGTRSASMADVARAAGVSTQTVSRVVNGSEAVRPDTAERVRDVMDEIGYRPSFAGRSLKTGSYRSIGLVMFDIRSTGNLDRLAGITAAAQERRYAITLIEMDKDKPQTLDEATRRMSALPVDGMIFNLNRMVEDFRTFRPLPSLPTVILTMIEHPACPTVDNDQHGCSEMVVAYLLEHGHRTIHHIAGPALSISGSMREEGWYDALAEAGIGAPEILRGDWSADSGYEAGATLAKDSSCTAVYASNDAMAYGAMAALRDAGRRVPEDVSVIGVDDALGGIVPHIDLTTVRFDNHQVGRLAFEKVIGPRSMAHKPLGVLVPGKLIERSTVAVARSH